MHKFVFSAVCISILAGAHALSIAAPVHAENASVSEGKAHASSIVGTWRAVSYRVWDANGTVQEPLGTRPAGYAVFDASGNVSIQILGEHDAASPMSEAARDAVAKSYGGYFGTYVIDAERSVVRMKVLGSNLPSYIGSTQERVFSIVGNKLLIGQPGKYQAVAERVQ